MKIISLLVLLYSTHIFALDAINCTGEEFNTLNIAHTAAKGHIEKAHDVLVKNDDALITTGMKKYFNVDYHSLNDMDHVAFIRETMRRLWANVGRVKYKCASNAGLYCSVGVLALVPPLSRVQICPSYFARPYEKQVGTLIHEWGHRWDFFRLKYIFERYCTDTAGESAAVLTVQPDSYMLFTYFLATNGVGINCFKLKEHHQQ